MKQILMLAALAVTLLGWAANSAADIAKWHKAAEQGAAWAQFNLGLTYYTGQGVPQDYKLATQWFRQAAKQGDVKSQYFMGWMHKQGEGVRQDYQRAGQWYRKAAEQGNAESQFELGVLCGRGLGVPQDYVQAHMWVNLAASQKAKYQTNRDRLAEQMTPAQIAEAQKLAREWKPKR